MIPTRTTPHAFFLAGGAALLVTTLIFAAGGETYSTGPTALDKGGTILVSADHALLATVEDAAVGITSDGDHVLHAGLIPALDFGGFWIHGIGEPSPDVVGVDGQSDFEWRATRNGDYELSVAGSVVDTGSVTAGTTVGSRILAAEMPADVWSDVTLSVTSGADRGGLSYHVYHDPSPPAYRDLRIVEAIGAVSSNRAGGPVDEVAAIIPGQPDAAVGLEPDASFTHSLPPGTTVVHYDLKNRFDRLSRRTIDFTGAERPRFEESPIGRTIFWASPAGEVEVDWTITSFDAKKGRFSGTGLIRLEGDPVEYPMGELRGKVKYRKKTDNYRVRMSWKKAKGAKPKTSVSFGNGSYANGVLTLKKLVVKVKKVFKQKYSGVAFRPLEDNGSPVDVARIRVEGTAEEIRDGSRIRLTTPGDTVEGISAVTFSEVLDRAADYALEIVAEDDANPPNVTTSVLRALVGRTD